MELLAGRHVVVPRDDAVGIDAGLTIEFLHEFPYAARAKFSFMEKGEDGWWRLPPEQHGTIPFLFSLQARK